MTEEIYEMDDLMALKQELPKKLGLKRIMKLRLNIKKTTKLK